MVPDDGSFQFSQYAEWPNDSIEPFDCSSWACSEEVQLSKRTYDSEVLPSIDSVVSIQYCLEQSLVSELSSPGFDPTYVYLDVSAFCPSQWDSNMWALPTFCGSDVASNTDVESPEASDGRVTRCSSPSDVSTLGALAMTSSESNTRSCAECLKSFARVSEIEEHAKRERHKPFSCRPCDKGFSRRDAYMRHQDLHKDQGQFPCPSCKKYQGVYAFRRRDHLRQHLRKFHRVHPNNEFPRWCKFKDCKLSSAYDSFSGFTLRKDYTKHMRESHGKETHDCTVTGCQRSGSKGFMRLNDLERHVKMAHMNTNSSTDVVDL